MIDVGPQPTRRLSMIYRSDARVCHPGWKATREERKVVPTISMWLADMEGIFRACPRAQSCPRTGSRLRY